MNKGINVLGAALSFFSGPAKAHAAPAVGDPAPLFDTQTDQGTPFQLESRKGKWTVLYFYPKDDTPGCTKQACAFRDSIEIIRQKGAEVYGVSKDTVESHQKFREKYHLTFPLLADPDGKIIYAFGAGGMLGFSKRWTFIIGPDLKIRWIQQDVDPAMNAKEVAAELDRLSR